MHNGVLVVGAAGVIRVLAVAFSFSLCRVCGGCLSRSALGYLVLRLEVEQQPAVRSAALYQNSNLRLQILIDFVLSATCQISCMHYNCVAYSDPCVNCTQTSAWDCIRNAKLPLIPACLRLRSASAPTWHAVVASVSRQRVSVLRSALAVTETISTFLSPLLLHLHHRASVKLPRSWRKPERRLRCANQRPRLKAKPQLRLS